MVDYSNKECQIKNLSFFSGVEPKKGYLRITPDGENQTRVVQKL